MKPLYTRNFQKIMMLLSGIILLQIFLGGCLWGLLDVPKAALGV